MSKPEKTIYQEWWFYVVILVFVAVIWMMLPKGTETGLDTFASCVSAKGAVMYGTEWCPHCKNQKELFGNSFKKINYVDCDANQEACLRARVNGYPTWTVGEQRVSGTQSIQSLSSLTGCEITYDN